MGADARGPEALELRVLEVEEAYAEEMACAAEARAAAEAARGELALGDHDASPEAAPAALGHLVLEPVPDLDVLEGRLAPAFNA